MSLLRTARTLRWLRPAQIAGQLRQRARRVVECPERWAQRQRIEPFPGLRRLPPDLHAPRAPSPDLEGLRAGRPAFAGETHAVGWPPDWDAPGASALWRYNLHYFEWLPGLATAEARASVEHWMRAHPLARGRIGWDAYPISLRAPQWCALFFGRDRDATLADRAFCDALWASLAQQLGWLEAHLEFHLLGNHLFENAAALAFCGACFDGESAARWRRRGAALLRRELAEQILDDGGHFERSPMYHLRVANVLDSLASTGDAEIAPLVREPLARMHRASQHLLHPDGEIALLNDAAFGIVAPPALEAAPGPFALPVSGYYGARTPAGDYLVCDAAPIGPDHLPGHAHADLLSFELSLGGRRVVVDAGVHDYAIGALRDWCRSTRAHNTVEVDEADQCELWAAFRVARRGHPREVVWQPGAQGFRLDAAHDGYLRLPARALHRRRFVWDDAGILLVRDRIEARAPVRVRSRLHLHPDCAFEAPAPEARRLRVRSPGGVFTLAFAGEGRLAVEPSIYSPRFGARIPNRTLLFETRGAQVDMAFCIAKGEALDSFSLESGALVKGRRIDG